MLTEKQERRRQQIRAAAYVVLERKGYKAASMLAIAKEAKASNETLYAWYGNKETLFRSLIEENADEVARALLRALDEAEEIEASLPRIGACLLALVTSDRAVALNRAAATDATETGELGRSLASAGRNSIAPLFERLFDQAMSRGSLRFDADDEVADVYIGLLLRDTQIRRTSGAAPPLSEEAITHRAARAASLFLQLYAP